MLETELHRLVDRARQGDIAAFGELVRATQQMVCSLCLRMLHCPQSAADAAQETYLRAFSRLAELREPAAFPGWLRRIALTTAAGLRRGGHLALVDAEALAEVPVLDENEARWSQSQREALALAIVHLPDADRELCDRFYHGGWSIARLAAEAQTTEIAMRKRLQRIRDHLREEIEMNQTDPTQMPQHLTEKIVELLSRPRLTTLPENPVGRIWQMIRAMTPAFEQVEVPEVVAEEDLQRAFGSPIIEQIAGARDGLHRIDSDRFLRADMTMPLLLSLKRRGGPLKITAAGKTYRAGKSDAMHLEAFHQAELLLVEESYSPWQFMDLLTSIVARFCPGRRMLIEQHNFALCDPGWTIAVDIEGQWSSVLGWGRYTDPVLAWLGCDPKRFTAVGAGLGLERLASLFYGIDDLRRIEAMRI